MALLLSPRKTGSWRLPSCSVELLDALADRPDDVRAFGLGCNQWRLQGLLKLKFAPIPFVAFR